MHFSSSRRAFTLIELLVVIAIIAILAVVVVLTLNPAEMLRQARDANRLSDLATINSALNLYTTDQSGSSGFSLGNASSVYLSLPDASSTCNNLGLATTSPSGISYACAVSTSSRNINNLGWIPVNLSLLSSGSPLGSLPIDPTNQSSSGLYYTYYTNGQQFEVTSLFESQKNKIQYGQKPIVQNLPELNAVGSSLSINPLFNPTGLVGYWPMDEGVGNLTQDLSGTSNGVWYGAASGTSGYYSAGKVGPYAGVFSGVNTVMYTLNTPAVGGSYTVSMWINPSAAQGATLSTSRSDIAAYRFLYNATGCLNVAYGGATQTTNCASSIGQWYYVTATYDGTTSKIYMNGSLVASAGPISLSGGTLGTNIGGNTPAGGQSFNGLIDDARIYNRPLSAAEVQALYNAEK
jgi:prepilin-type N-terminal cleavage/methylation domain-containing protein